jgi:hypothetical protein
MPCARSKKHIGLIKKDDSSNYQSMRGNLDFFLEKQASSLQNVSAAGANDMASNARYNSYD